MKALNWRKQLGFTLIETIITLVILGAVAGIAGQLLAQAFTGTQEAEEIDELNWKARQGLERLSRDLREVDPSELTTITGSQLVYTSASGEAVTYSYGAGTLTRNGNALLTNISNFSFVYYDGTGTVTAVTDDVRFIQFVAEFTFDNNVSPLYYTAVALHNP